ncbi:MAG TPA: SDR family oxidoreductase [Polyangiaceae bacterium]|nr:SDR family oxidoreductase [Polyangiaceae bacterium]
MATRGMELTGIRGRVALVTGAGGGIGAACARALAAEGALVAVTDLDGARAASVAAAIVAGGRGPDGAGEARGAGEAAAPGAARAYALDVADGDAVEGAFERVGRELGPVDILVNVAGVFLERPALELSLADFDRLFAVNARGVFACCRAAARGMAGRGRGAIVTVSSQSAKVVRTGQAVYGASKCAAAYATKCFGLELAARGVRCNVVYPGVTDTPLARAVWDAAPGGRAARVAAHVGGDPARYRAPLPLGKIASPEDVAGVVAFLASDRAGHITLADLVVDGGAALLA